MEEKVKQFVAEYTGVAGVGDTPQNIGECVGLVEKFLDFLGLPHVWGNANQLLQNADPKSYQIVYNDPNNLNQYPPVGAIISLGKPYGPFKNTDGTISYNGHTGIIIAATGLNFRMFAQNNPDGSTPHLEDHPEGYGAVVGWLVPILPAAQTAVNTTLNYHGLDPNNMQSIQVALDTWYAVSQGQYVPFSEYTALKISVSSETDQVSQLQGQLELALAKQGDLQKTIDDLNSKHAADTKEIAAINGALSDLTGSNKDYANEILAAETLASDRLAYIHSMTDALHLPQTNIDDKALVEDALTEIARLQKNQAPTQGEAEKTLSMWENHFLTIIQGILANGRFNAWLKANGFQVVDANGNFQETDLGEKVVSFLDDTFKKLSFLEQAQAKLQSAQDTIVKAQPFLVKLSNGIARIIFTDKHLNGGGK